MTIVAKKRPTVGVILPLLSGFYMGEISATLRTMAKSYDVNLVLVRSGENHEFDYPAALHHFDALIVILHTASDSYIQTALARGIPVISVGGSYAPLEVEQFTSNQSLGVELLYQWLVEQGHQHIGFCGDLSVNDVRARFKAYQRVVAGHNNDFDIGRFFSVSSCSIAGGREAANEFIRRESPCTAVICATDHNAIGMIEQFKNSRIQVPQDVAVVGIDNIFFGQHVQPALTTVDQQLERLTRQAFVRALERINGSSLSAKIHPVSQKLIVRHSCGNAQPDCIVNENQGSIRHQLLNVAGRSPAEVFENFYAQAQNGFGSILDAHSLYGNNLDWACLAHGEQNNYRVESWINVGMIKPCHNDINQQSFSDVRDFPNLSNEEHFVATILPIATGRKNSWKLIAVVDGLKQEQNIGTQSVFCSYLDMLALFIERGELLNTSNLRQRNSEQLLELLNVVSNSSNDGIWDWSITDNTLRLNERLVNMLGHSELTHKHDIDSDLLFRLIHPEDLCLFEEHVEQHLVNQAPLKIELRLQKQDNNYIWVLVSGASITSDSAQSSRIVGSITDITHQKESAAKIHHMAYFDALTGVPNRRKVMEDIAKHIADDGATPVAVMLMDLNRFKSINDTFGHHVGDALLCHVTDVLKDIVKKPHTIARLGGDEFLFFCHTRTRVEAETIAHQILRAIESPMLHEEIELVVQSSIGVAFYPFDGQSASALVKKADIAMYQAKKAGGNQVVHFHETMQVNGQNALKMEYHLIRAIDKQEISLFYQPQFCHSSGVVIGVEALARWHSPELGEISPTQFVKLAEKIGVINRLGEYLLHRTCQDVVNSTWLRSLRRISINVSAKQLISPHFAQEIIETITQYRLPLSLFCIEITETAVIEDYDVCVASLLKLRNVGIDISLDDFGTGFSSLSLLKRLPLNEVKIDRGFISDVVNSQSNLAFVSTMVSMGQSLGYRIVMEGVETQEHAKKLSTLGAEISQGYYYSKPLSLAELEHKYACATEPMSQRVCVHCS